MHLVRVDPGAPVSGNLAGFIAHAACGHVVDPVLQQVGRSGLPLGKLGSGELLDDATRLDNLGASLFLGRLDVVDVSLAGLLGLFKNDRLIAGGDITPDIIICLLYTSPSPRDRQKSRMPSSA